MKPTQRRILYAFLLIVVVIAIIGLILIKGPLAPTPVQTARLQKGDLAPAVFGIGTVEARRSYALGFTRAGRLATLEADEGDRVQAEQQLGSLDPVDLPQRIRSAAAMVRKTEKLVNAAESALREARARHQQARREMLRYQELARAKQVSQDVAENRASEAMAALQKVHEAEANLEAIKLDNERARADLQALKVQLQELSLVSPAEGI
ncbi:MAG TPA: efflux transporter periplasmic adaptor subunit, partial [Thiotrichales bacterium]|nr:efflux transporter periplasmic adaptor subunit [Thiotrichales bacterium]